MTEKEVKELINDYHWMLNGVEYYRCKLDEQVEFKSVKENDSDPLYFEISRRNRRVEAMKRLENKTLMLQEQRKLFDNERDQITYDLMLDGLSIRQIAKETGLSRGIVNEVRNTIAKRIAKNQQSKDKGG